MSLLQRIQDRERAWHLSLSRDVTSPRGRRRARFYFNWIDHAVLRVWWWNRGQISAGVFRTNQPSPARLRIHRDAGITTILNLRGASDYAHYLFEVEACREIGLELIDFPLRAKQAMPRDTILGLIDLLPDVPTPFVMHCKSGSDRTGFAAVIYRHVVLGEDMEDALAELSWKYIHLRRSKFGILDVFFEMYLEARTASGIGFREWVATDYDPDALTQRFRGKS